MGHCVRAVGLRWGTAPPRSDRERSLPFGTPHVLGVGDEEPDGITDREVSASRIGGSWPRNQLRALIT